MSSSVSSHLSVFPVNVNASEVEASKLLEHGGGGVDAVSSAARAFVHNYGTDGLATVGDLNSLAAVPILVWGRHGNNGFTLGVGLATGTKSRCVVGHLTRGCERWGDKGADSDDDLSDGVHFELKIGLFS